MCSLSVVAGQHVACQSWRASVQPVSRGGPACRSTCASCEDISEDRRNILL